jgi:L-alanine-DL-glutamate epimerase-like enolase superfamily enzyme
VSATEIVSVELGSADMPLREPFGIATGAQRIAANAFVRIVLRDGAEGWGEAAPFADVNGDSQGAAVAAVRNIAPDLVGRDARAWSIVGDWLLPRAPRSPSARCALETAMLDAIASHYGVALWVLLGGSGSSLQTDLTITTGTAEAARAAAERIAREGYGTIKLKVGGVPLEHDLARIEAVVGAAPSCGLLLDGNAAIPDANAALDLVRETQRRGGRIVLFEQPLARDDHDGMRALVERSGVRIGADEGASSVGDVLTIAQRRSAHVVNLKIMKSGVIEALRMASVAKAHGLALMIGGMVESELAMSMSAALAAGLGGFEFVDLDTPLWLLDSPIEGGYVQTGPRLDLSGVIAGHGARPRTGTIDMQRVAG